MGNPREVDIIRRKIITLVETLGVNRLKKLDEVIKKILPSLEKIEEVESKQSSASNSNIKNKVLSQEAGENLDFHYGRTSEEND